MTRLPPTALWGMEDLLVLSSSLVAWALVALAWQRRANTPNLWAKGWYLSLVLAGTAAGALGIAALLGGWRIGSAVGASMLPTMSYSNLVVVDTYTYGWRMPFHGWATGPTTPERGAVVSFHFAAEGADRLLAKRVIGLPGDTIAYSGDRLIVNGMPIAAPPRSGARQALLGGQPAVEREARLGARRFRVLSPVLTPNWYRHAGKVPADHVFVVGDNWAESYDSRELGPVPLDNLRGEVVWVWSQEKGWSRP